MDFSTFTDAQVQAWDWIRSAVDSGETATDALAAYRAEGGAIRSQDWYRAFSSVKTYGDTWDTINTFTSTETIPERFWLDAPRNFANTYVTEVELSFRNIETNELQRAFRYIESDYRMSKSEIDNAVAQMGMDYVESEQWIPEYTYGYKFYKKGK
jgi:oligoribonuclease NrnB/cAMP/cGMP phosphodiesterase (DHH superfamily)